MHATSQAHELEHLIRLWHELMPVHVTLQGPVPHRISSAQLSLPVHCTSHEVARPHVTCFAHAVSPQRTRHGTFGGQTTSCWQLDVAPQSITQTPAGSHVPLLQPSAHRFDASGPGASEVIGPESVVAGAPHAVAFGSAHQPSRQT